MNLKLGNHIPRDTGEGLIAYLDEVAEGFAGLEEHGCIYTEEQKMTTLLSNLHLEPNDAYLLTYCRDTFSSFEACYQYLRKGSHTPNT